MDYNQVRSNVVFVDDGVGDPNDGCDSILNVNDVSGKIVIMNRSSNCGIAGQTIKTQEAGAIGAIIINPQGQALTSLGTGPSTVLIPYVAINHGTGQEILDKLDNGIIVHECGHGISNRLTDGPSSSGCLSNVKQMGEGWS